MLRVDYFDNLITFSLFGKIICICELCDESYTTVFRESTKGAPTYTIRFLYDSLHRSDLMKTLVFTDYVIMWFTEMSIKGVLQHTRSNPKQELCRMQTIPCTRMHCNRSQMTSQRVKNKTYDTRRNRPVRLVNYHHVKFVWYVNTPTYDVTLHNDLLKYHEFLDDPNTFIFRNVYWNHLKLCIYMCISHD